MMRTLLIASLLLLVFGSLLGGLAANGLTARQARDLLRKLGGAELKPEQVRIKTISNGPIGSSAVVEAQIETAIRFKEEKGKWEVADIRLGDRHWESVELLTEAVRREKTRRTEQRLQQLSEALERYKAARGGYLAADTYAQLMQQLSPQYLPLPLPLDWWEQPFSYRGTAQSYRLGSAGPDLQHGTSDDLVIEKR